MARSCDDGGGAPQPGFLDQIYFGNRYTGVYTCAGSFLCIKLTVIFGINGTMIENPQPLIGVHDQRPRWGAN